MDEGHPAYIRFPHPWAGGAPRSPGPHRFSKVYNDAALQKALCHYAVINLKELSGMSDFHMILPEDFMLIVNDPLFVCYEVDKYKNVTGNVDKSNFQSKGD